MGGLVDYVNVYYETTGLGCTKSYLDSFAACWY
jgi:hypothetical protein